MTVLPAPPTLQLMTSGTWISTEGYRPFKCESFTKALRFVICRLLALFGIYIYIFVVTDNSRLQPRPQAAFPWLLWKSALLGTRLLRTSFDRSECRGTEVRDQTEIAWYCPQFSMGNSFPNMSVTELWRASSAFSFWFGFLRCVEYGSSVVPCE